MHSPQCLPAVANLPTVVPVKNPAGYVQALGSNGTRFDIAARKGQAFVISVGQSTTGPGSVRVELYGPRGVNIDTEDRRGRAIFFAPLGSTRVVLTDDVLFIDVFGDDNSATWVSVWLEDIGVLGHWWDFLISCIRGKK